MRAEERKEEWGILTREDIGYGPATQYERGAGDDGPLRRERRSVVRSDPVPGAETGPYHGRLQRQARPDEWVRADLEEKLFLDTWIDADRITVEVEGGDLTMIGTLPDRGEISRALRIARRIPGVRKIRNYLEVESRPIDSEG